MTWIAIPFALVTVLAAFGGGAPRLPLSAKDGCSGHAPVSMTPMMTPLPALAAPPTLPTWSN